VLPNLPYRLDYNHPLDYTIFNSNGVRPGASISPSIIP
jgi:hypothetical protein